MKALYLLTLFLASSAGAAAPTDAWLTGWPQGASPQDIPSSDVAEIPHSLFEYAQDLLKESPAMRISSNYFPGVQRQCPKGSNLYLVRALYEHPRTGTFLLARAGDDLFVRHEALGAAGELHRSALLACLIFEPKHVFVTTGGAL